MLQTKKWIFPACMAVVCCLSFSFSGCGKGEPNPTTVRAAAFSSPRYDWQEDAGQTLTLWVRQQEGERIHFKRALERYEEKTSGHVEVRSLPSTQFEQILIDAFAGKGDQPDLVLSYGGTNIEALSPDEPFYDFTEAVWVDDLTSTSINQTIYGGKVMGLPHWEASVSGTLYNKKIFKKLDLEIPQSQEAFLQLCQTLLDNDIIPVYMPFTDITSLLYQFPLDAVVEDPEVLAGLNNGTLRYSDIPQMKIIVEWYHTMAQRGFFGPDFEQCGWSGMDAAMREGQYAMMLCWDTWLYTDFTGDASQFGLMPAFMGVPGEGTFEGPNLNLLMVNKNSPQLSSALNLVTFMADPYNYNVAFEGIYTAPVFKNQVASISTPQYVEAERLIERHFRDSTAWLRIRGFSQTDASCIQKYMTNTPGYTLEQCLREMDTLREQRAFGKVHS